MRRILKLGFALVLLLAVFVGGWIAGRLGIGSVVEPSSLSEAERAFTERMHDVVLVGTFTVSGRDRPPRTERYEIASVEKVGDDLWRFNAKMDCCGLNGGIPIVVPLRFVGDTPMIMMTDTSLPGIGSYTVRLFFYRDRYSGTWQGDKAGGLMSGRIEKKSTVDRAQ
jgi:hypothetical protein